MPKAVERRLRAVARKRGYSQSRTDRYVYGTMNKIKGNSRRRNRRKGYRTT